MQKSNIQPALFQQMLDSATNAAEKGQAQYFTPAKWAKLLAIPLPSHRPVILDLTCGRGDLLRGAMNASTEHRLGCDIDPGCFAKGPMTKPQGPRAESESSLGLVPCALDLPPGRFPADLTLLYPLLRDVEFQADLFTLNPPWDLHWHRDRLQRLAESDLASVRNAFSSPSPLNGLRTKSRREESPSVAGVRGEAKSWIDSTVATLCLALDRCSDYGEGYLIANASTAQRLILDDNAPHVALRDHVWAVVQLPEKTAAPVPSCVLYFAKDHLQGPKFKSQGPSPGTLDLGPWALDLFTRLSRERVNLREGAEVRPYLFTLDTVKCWTAAAEEYQRVSTLNSPASQPRYNLWLTHTGHISAHVSLYENITGRVPKEEAALLHSLAGQRPLQLVVQRAQREALLRACGLKRAEEKRRKGAEEQEAGDSLPSAPLPLCPSAVSSDSPWRVDPDLQAAVLEAIRQYNAARAPLYPLPAIQRLGYLDEEDWIVCDKSLYSGSEKEQRRKGEKEQDTGASSPSSPLPLCPSAALFLPGRRYPITTQTLAVRRASTRISLAGEEEELELTGQELAIFIESELGERLCFMEQRLLQDDVRIQNPGTSLSASRGEGRGEVKKSSLSDDSFLPASEVIHFTLQQLVDVFIVPDVPDVAAVNPAGYQRNLELLQQIESLCR